MHICEVGERIGYDWASSPARGPVRRRALHPCAQGRDREPHAHHLHRQLRPHRGHGPGRGGRSRLECRDMQHIAEDHFLWEVVDPQTGEPVDEGEEGELVLTTLAKEAQPRAALPHARHTPASSSEPCACGRALAAHGEGPGAAATTCSSSAAPTCSPARSRTCSPRSRAPRPTTTLVIDDGTGFDRMTLMLEVKPTHFSDEVAKMDRFRDLIAAKLRRPCRSAQSSSWWSPDRSSAPPARPSTWRTAGRSSNGRRWLNVANHWVYIGACASLAPGVACLQAGTGRHHEKEPRA